MLSWAYSRMVANLDAEKRARLDRALSPAPVLADDDPAVPPAVQGLTPPSWWTDSGFDGAINVPTG